MQSILRTQNILRTLRVLKAACATRGELCASEPPHANDSPGRTRALAGMRFGPRKRRRRLSATKPANRRPAALIPDSAHRANAGALTAMNAFLLVDLRKPVAALTDRPDGAHPERGAGMIGRAAIRVYVHGSHLSSLSIRDRAARHSDKVTLLRAGRTDRNRLS